MKRKDLQVGQRVAIMRSRDSHWFDEGFVVATEAWKERKGWSYHGTEFFKPASDHDSKGGVAVAKKGTRFGNAEERWVPAVEQLGKLVPYEEAVEARDAQLRRVNESRRLESERYAENKRRLEELRENARVRGGLRSIELAYDADKYGYIKVAMADVERLLEHWPGEDA